MAAKRKNRASSQKTAPKKARKKARTGKVAKKAVTKKVTAKRVSKKAARKKSTASSSASIEERLQARLDSIVQRYESKLQRLAERLESVRAKSEARLAVLQGKLSEKNQLIVDLRAQRINLKKERSAALAQAKNAESIAQKTLPPQKSLEAKVSDLTEKLRRERAGAKAKAESLKQSQELVRDLKKSLRQLEKGQVTPTQARPRASRRLPKSSTQEASAPVFEVAGNESLSFDDDLPEMEAARLDHGSDIDGDSAPINDGNESEAVPGDADDE